MSKDLIERLRGPYDSEDQLAKMRTQGEFNAFFNTACQIVCAELVPHLTPSVLRTQIEGMLGINAEVR